MNGVLNKCRYVMTVVLAFSIVYGLGLCCGAVASYLVNNMYISPE